MPIQGSCLCGEIRFEIDGRVSDVSLCHCSVCRRASGHAGTAVAATSVRSLHWKAGEGLATGFALASGWKTAFCPACGSPTPILHENGKIYLLPAGLLDASAVLETAQHIFVASKASWDTVGGDAPQHDEWAPEA